MLIGYVRRSKGDGSQMLALQRDLLLAAGVGTERIYQDLGRLKGGRARDDRADDGSRPAGVIRLTRYGQSRMISG